MRHTKISLAAALLMAAYLAMPAGATAANDKSYSTTIGGTKTTTLTKYLVMDKDTNVPNVSFSFSIAAGGHVDGNVDEGTLEVKEGILTGLVKSGDGTVSFSSSDSAIDESEKGTETPVFATAGDTDEKFVKKTLDLDFKDVPFPEPGVYRYVITEDASTSPLDYVTYGYEGASAASNETIRTLDVYVVDDTAAGSTNLKLSIAGYVFYKGTQTAGPKASTSTTAVSPNNGAEVPGATKSPTITNYYNTQDLTFGKAVTGNQGSKDKYFKFTLNLTGAPANTTYSVDLSKAVETSGSNTATKSGYQNQPNPATITVGNDGKGSAVFYLQHGQYITVQGVTKGVGYALTEDKEEYTSADGITAGNSLLNWDGEDGNDALTDPANGSINIADIHTGFTNTKTGSIPTGVAMTVAGSAALVLLGAAGVTAGAVMVKKKRHEDE